MACRCYKTCVRRYILKRIGIKCEASNKLDKCKDCPKFISKKNKGE